MLKQWYDLADQLAKGLCCRVRSMKICQEIDELEYEEDPFEDPEVQAFLRG